MKDVLDKGQEAVKKRGFIVNTNGDCWPYYIVASNKKDINKYRCWNSKSSLAKKYLRGIMVSRAEDNRKSKSTRAETPGKEVENGRHR